MYIYLGYFYQQLKVLSKALQLLTHVSAKLWQHLWMSEKLRWNDDVSFPAAAVSAAFFLCLQTILLRIFVQIADILISCSKIVHMLL